MAKQLKSYLDLVQECDGLPYPDQPDYARVTSNFFRFRLKETWTAGISNLVTVGWMLPSVVEKMPWTDKFRVDYDHRMVDIPYAAGDNYETRAIAEQLEVARNAGSFEILRKWRGELYRILNLNRDVRMPRGGSALFGIQTVGVHVTAYTNEEKTGEMKIWVPRRSPGKQTYPGMFDNTVGGGLIADEHPLECMLREAQEEASLPEDWMRVYAQPAGTVSYFLVRDSRAGGELGLLQPSTQHVYDVALPSHILPRPSDGEVEAFYLWTVEQVIDTLKKGQFKPNSAVTLIDFLIRHGRITAEDEPDFRMLVSRIHRRLHF